MQRLVKVLGPFPKSVPTHVVRRRPIQSLITEEKYNYLVRLMHWTMGFGIVGIIGTVKTAQNTKVEAEKAKWMWIHKSLGLTMGGLIVPRILLRLAYKPPSPISGTAAWEHFSGNINHNLLYSLMIAMPATGITMGYFGGKGLPFFWTSIPGTTQPNRAIAVNAFKIHKLMGTGLEILTVLHISAALVWHQVIRGHRLLQRMNLFTK